MGLKVPYFTLGQSLLWQLLVVLHFFLAAASFCTSSLQQLRCSTALAMSTHVGCSNSEQPLDLHRASVKSTKSRCSIILITSRATGTMDTQHIFSALQWRVLGVFLNRGHLRQCRWPKCPFDSFAKCPFWLGRSWDSVEIEELPVSKRDNCHI